MIVATDTVAIWFPSAPTEELGVAHAAAESFVSSRARWPRVASDGTLLDPPGAIVEAIKLMTARYLQRRNSPDGLVGMGDMGAVRVTSVDRDVVALIAPWSPAVFG